MIFQVWANGKMIMETEDQQSALYCYAKTAQTNLRMPDDGSGQGHNTVEFRHVENGKPNWFTRITVEHGKIHENSYS